MSQDLLLKTPVAPLAPKVENTKVSNQPKRPENTEEPSFSSTLDKQVEQSEHPRKEPVENIEKSAGQTNEDIKENITKDEDGNILPETTAAESETTDISAEVITDLVDEDVDVSIVTELKSESSKPSPAKLVSAEQLITAKVVTSDKPAVKSLNKEKPSSILGANAELVGKGDNANGLELDKKPQTTNLRSDIFHALSKNKASEVIALDDLGNKALTKGSERNQTGFAAALTSAATLNSASIQNSASTQPVLAVQPTMQSSAWNQVMSSRVVWMAREGISEASLKLNPANLGSVEVKLNMHNDQANVLFISHNAATRDALEQALPRLRESFEQNGMQLADADVSGQESEHAEEEQAGEAGVHNGKGQSASLATENEQQSESVEQEIEMGLSIYA